MRRILALLPATLLVACSTEMVYNSAQQVQLAECRKLNNLDERQRCEKRAGGSYEDYKAKAGAATRP